MALARLALKKLQQRVLSSSSSFLSVTVSNNSKQQRWESQLMNRLYTTSAADDKETPSTGSQVAVSDQGGSKSSLSTKKPRKRNLWRNNNREFVPALWGLGNALMQATENINRVFEKLGPSHLFGQFKEKEECYKLKYKMPGIDKDDVKITVEDGGVLRIRGEHEQEEDEELGGVDKYWAYYDTRVVLPDDAKIDEIKAELKHGVLKITIPRDEKHKKDVKEIKVD